MHIEIITHRPSGAARPTPLLFVHGAWHGAWCWEEHFLPYFAAAGYEAHALSLRGHGKSAGNARWASVDDYINDIEQVARSLSQPPVLIGHSLGGYLVQKYVEERRAPAAVLLATLPVHGALPFLLRHLRRYPAAMLKGLLTATTLPFVGTPQISRAAFFSPDMPDETVQRYHDRLVNESVRVGLASALYNFPQPLRVNVPVLVIGAANDRVFTVHEIEKTALVYNTKAVILPDMAHDMMLETGWQRAADVILAWLRERGF
jgi:pimeloyl-ACP methyl ester carboxylesterase